jgi:hypothetical protein
MELDIIDSDTFVSSGTGLIKKKLGDVYFQIKITFLGSFYINTLSFIPNLHSGVPLNKAFTFTSPLTSALKTDPFTDINKLTLSTTSI